jgi:NADP-dependent 3-hydroxy acid dehydrogenase YdfG
MSKQKVWFITGASKGLGLEVAKTVLAKGDKVLFLIEKMVYISKPRFRVYLFLH